MKYHYFVSYYSLNVKSKNSAIANDEVCLSKKITSLNDIREIEKKISEKYIRKNSLSKNVAYQIISFHLLYTEDN